MEHAGRVVYLIKFYQHLRPSQFLIRRTQPPWFLRALARVNPSHSQLKPQVNDAEGIPLLVEGGTFVIPVLINGQITLNFTIDSGAADVSIPADVVSTLMRTGTIQESDFVGQKMYRLADGSTVPSATFLIRSLKVGNHLLENVMGSVASAQADLLLGQSFLSRFNSWSIDNKRQVLLLN